MASRPFWERKKLGKYFQKNTVKIWIMWIDPTTLVFTVSQLVVIHRRWDKPKCPWGNNHSQRVPVIGNPPQNHTPGIEWHRVYLWSQTHPTLLQPNYPWWGNSFSMNHLLIKLMYTRQLWHDLYYQITWNKIIDTLTNNWFLCCIYLHWNILI